LQGGVWDRKTFSKGVELKGKTVGVVGLGMIGTEVARRCQALDMTTIGFDPLMTEEKAAAAGACGRSRAFGDSGLQSALELRGGLVEG
jgi:D-3-phosphoglycerate dehydrogenase